MQHIQLIFQIFIIAMIAWIFLSFRSKASQVKNEMCVAEWFSEMDAAVQGQRWRGSRSMMVESLHMEKRFAGINVDLLCVTRSGRWFVFTAETRFSLIVNWNIEPVSEESAAAHLNLDLKELAATKNGLAWPVERPPVTTQQAPQDIKKQVL